MIEIFKELEERIKSNQASVLVTIIDMKGSTPGKAGFKMLVGPEGRITGTVGGGGVEYHAENKSKELIKNGVKNLTETLIMKDSLLGNDKNNIEVKNNKDIEINALCGGEVTLFYEVYQNARTIYIFGGGHVGQAAAKLAKELGYFVTMYDNRQNIIDELREGSFDKKVLADFSNLNLKEKDYIKLDINGYAVILTHNHVNDLNVLEFIYNNYPDMKYIGMIGSRRKVKEGVTFIKSKFNHNLNLNNLYAPIGIEIGGDSPNEIALGIMAEIQALANGKKVNHLRLNYDELK